MRRPSHIKAVRIFVFTSLGFALALLSAPGSAAQAETPIRLEAPAPPAPRLRLDRLASPYDADQAMKAAGIAHTSLDRSFEDRAATASVGLLCGLQPSTETRGAAGARGVDEDGRFLGAQLRLGFH